MGQSGEAVAPFVVDVRGCRAGRGFALGEVAQVARDADVVEIGVSLFEQRRDAGDVGGGLACADEGQAERGGEVGVRADDVGFGSAVGGWSLPAVGGDGGIGAVVRRRADCDERFVVDFAGVGDGAAAGALEGEVAAEFADLHPVGVGAAGFARD